MKFLLFDASANGQPKSYQASFRDSFNWPRMFHLSWQLLNEKGQILASRNDLIAPIGFSLSPTIEKKHKVKQDELKSNGIPVRESIDAFMSIVPDADMVFAHNLALNQGVVTAEADRAEILERLSSAETYCLMQEATYFCAIPGKGGKYKWPSLTEIHSRIFNRSYSNAGRADADVQALARCFIVMYKTGVLEDIFDE